MPSATAQGVRALFVVRGAPPRLAYALRAGVCMGAPVLAGVLLGHVDEGLMATIGAFTSLYGSGRPYAYRGVMLGLIAIGFALAVAGGVAASGWYPAALLTMTLVAMLATLLCRELNTGPPGAYMFTLACAVGTALSASHLTVLHVALLVLAGGAFSWIAHMMGALFQPRAPEKMAVLHASRATCEFIRAVGASTQDAARHRAALALHEAWNSLVTYQPLRLQAERNLGQLRAINRELHLLFAEAIRQSARAQAMPHASIERARLIAERARDPRNMVQVAGTDIPLSRLTALESLREALRPGSISLRVVLRVGIAALLAGGLGAAMALDHVYWSVAAAVLVLHVGYDWRRTVQRGLERLFGTWVGLLLAAAVLAARPKGLWLVATVMLLQAIVEMLVVRNYALAVTVVTPMALLVGSGSGIVSDVHALLIARGVDTTLGCLAGIAVYALVTRRTEAASLRHELVATCEATEPVLEHLKTGTVKSRSARAARLALQRRLFVLAETFDIAMGGMARERVEAEQTWPDVEATQRVGYQALSMCWHQECGEMQTAAEIEALAQERQQLRESIAPEPQLSNI